MEIVKIDEQGRISISASMRGKFETNLSSLEVIED
jgi:DNA-binding transcriptional regulator/RsmH inhibitor MraZ